MRRGGALDGQHEAGQQSARGRAASLIDPIPVPAVVMRDGVCVAANASYLQLLGLEERDVVGRSRAELIAERVAPADQRIAATGQDFVHATPTGHLWCRIRDATGRELPQRLVWFRGPEPDELFVFLFDAAPEAFGREISDSLARAAGWLGSCATEHEVLERGCDALAAHELTVTVLLIDPSDPLLRFGPSRSPFPPSDRPYERARPPSAVLEAINPGFARRRAAFFQDGMRLVREAFPERLAEDIVRILPSQRMVQAPLFVDDQPYGALVVTGEPLTPVLASAIELFAELMARAIENVRLRRERVQHERLAALGEAAAVMAHEVRNPVAALLNAATLLGRAKEDDRDTVVRVIVEEAMRLERLVEGLLTLGRPLAPRPCTLALESLGEAALALITQRGFVPIVDVETVSPPRPMLVHADEDLLQLAVTNVVRNAAQSSRRLRISFEEADGSRALVVEDDGVGFSDEAVRRAGEPFFTTRPSGTGVGLAVVRRVLEASGGHLEVDKARALAGARVALWLPSALEPTEPGPPLPAPIPSAEGK